MKNNDKYVEAKKYLQKRYPKELSDKRWNTSDINDDWVTEMMTDFASQSKPQEIPEENRQKLFNHMSTEHGLTLLESEMNSLYSICIGHEEYVKYLNWLHSKPQEIKPVDTKTVDAVDALIVLTFTRNGHISGVDAPDTIIKFKTLEQFAESGYNGNFDNDSYYTLESIYIESKK